MDDAGSATLRRSLLWGAVWLAAAALSAWRFEAGQAIPILWLPGGIALAALVHDRAAWRPLLGAFAAAALGFELVQTTPVASAVALAAVHVIEPVLVAGVLRIWSARRARSVVSEYGLLIVASLPVTLLGAAAATFLTAPLAGDRGAVVSNAWGAHHLGMVLTASLAWRLPIRTSAAWRVSWPRLVEAGFLFSLLLALSRTVFTVPAGEAPLRAFPFIALPVLVWAAVRFGARGVSAATLLLSFDVMRAVAAGAGPFAHAGVSLALGVLQAQVFLAILWLSMLVLALALEGRDSAIGELRRSELALQTEKELSRQAEAAAHFGSWRFDLADQTILLSEGGLRLTDLAHDSDGTSLAQAAAERLHPDDAERFAEALAEIRGDQPMRARELRIRLANGAVRTLRTQGGPVVRDPSGAPRYVYGVIEDVTETRQLEAALRESEERYRGVFEDTPTIMLILDPENGAVVDANPAACAFYGRPREQMRSLRIYDINSLPAAKVATFLERARQASGLRYEFTHRLASGELRDVFVYSGPVRVGGRTLLHSVIHDVTESRRAEEAARRGLRAASATLRSVIDASPLGTVVFDEALRVRLVNPAARAIFAAGAEGIEGRAAAELLGQDQAREILVPALEGRPVVGAEIETRRGDGTPLVLRAFAGPVTGFESETRGVVALFEDASERRMMEETFQLAQKLEVLATVAGGVAHDFNNLLTVVLGQTERALRKLPSESPARPHLARALPAVEQAIVLAGKMLTYSGGSRPVVGPLDLAALVHDDRALLEAAVPAHVTLQLELAGGVPAIEASAEEVRQAVTALLSNAVEAIGGRRGKVRLRVATRTLLEADGTFARHTGRPLAAGEYASLEVTDDGGGIRPDCLPRIFDPFFTTKFVGRGLGLAAVLGIMRSHRGGVAVESALSRGSRFELVFPALGCGAVVSDERA